MTDSNGNKYLLGAGELSKQLGIKWQNHSISGKDTITGQQGIIYFENYHIDLWDGSKMVGNGEDWYDKKVYFMELP